METLAFIQSSQKPATYKLSNNRRLHTRLVAQANNVSTASNVNNEPWRKKFIEFSAKMAGAGIRVIHEPFGPANPNAPVEPRRLIMTNMTRNVTDDINLECNGLILEMNTLKPLVIPPKQFIISINTDITNAALTKGLYDIFAIEDGTTINLYHWPIQNCTTGVWRIATANGIDVSDIRWNNKTYREVLHECFEKTGVDVDKFYASLDPTRCYSIGFRHPDFHPFASSVEDMPKFKVWSIQSVGGFDQTNAGTRSYEPFGGLTNQELLEPIVNVRPLYRKLAKAFQEYIDGERIDKNEHASKTVVNFGYILRPKDPNSDMRHILLESSLMRSIKYMHYSRRITREASLMKYDRIKYLILKAYVSQNSRNFIILFPCYSVQYEQLDQLIQKLSAAILTNNTTDKIMAIAATKIRNNMQRLISKQTNISAATVASFIRTAHYIDVIYHLWEDTAEAEPAAAAAEPAPAAAVAAAVAAAI